MGHLIMLRTIALVVLSCAACGARAEPAPAPLVRTHPAMATEFSVTIFPRADEAAASLVGLIDEIFADIDALEAIISEWKPDSQTTYVNNHAADEPVRVPVELMDLLLASKACYERTDGIFDVTVGPLSKLYGFYEDKGHQPTEDELREALERVGMDKITLDPQARTVQFQKAGMRLDFGGIGKGFALDRAAEKLRARGVKNALLSAGTSSIYALGAPPGEPGWKVHIRHPYNDGEKMVTVMLRDESLSTSGCYGDLPVVDGVRICNLFDPRTGQAQHGIVSASAIAPTATETEALGKAFLILGVEGARAFCGRNPGVRGILVPESPGSVVNVELIGPQDDPRAEE